MKIFHAVGLNFIGGVWIGVLIIFSTPYFVSALGLDGYGLIAFWQILLALSAIFDFGLGASLVREFSKYKGSNERNSRYCDLLSSLELLYILIAIFLWLAIYFSANWLATSWLKLDSISQYEASLTIEWMAGSISLQFLATLYFNGLAGLQRHKTFNGLQILSNTLKYLGGLVVIYFDTYLPNFFQYQVFFAFIICCIARMQVMKYTNKSGMNFSSADGFAQVGKLLKYSGGMFLTTLCGLLLANADRIVLSKLMSADDLGKYTLAFTAAGVMQMVVLAFYRSYFPKFSELKASGDCTGLKITYYQGCRYVGVVLLPTSVAAFAFAPELFQVWIGYTDDSVLFAFRLLIIATASSGLMWLPAALQQANGWTRLHVSLMILALFGGLPILIIGIKLVGMVGATAMMMVHGLIEITLGLWLMNRVLYPGENLHWYKLVVVIPLAISVPIAFFSYFAMPTNISELVTLIWLAVTGTIMLIATFLLNRWLDKRYVF